MMNAKNVLQMLQELRVLRFFPNDEFVMVALMRLCESMCETEEQVEWLVSRMTSGIYSEWTGIGEVRACFCHRYKPKDGINAYSTVYPDGLPPDPTAPPRSGIAAPVLKALPPGHGATADNELDASIQRLAKKSTMPPARLHDSTKTLLVAALRECRSDFSADIVEFAESVSDDGRQIKIRLANPKEKRLLNLDALQEALARLRLADRTVEITGTQVAAFEPPRKQAEAVRRRESEELRPINPNFKPITPADVEKAVRELHERRAREAEEQKEEK